MARTELSSSTSSAPTYVFGTSAYDYSLYAGTTSSLRVVSEYPPASKAVCAALRAEERRRGVQAKAASRRDVMVLGLVLLFVMGAMLVAWHAQAGAAPMASATPTAVEMIAVAEGDTLWGISERHPVAGLTTQEGVRWIMERNNLSSSMLQVGQVIEVPRT